MLFEQSLMEEAERHSRRLGTLAIAASNASWKHDEAIRAVRHAHGAARKDALDRLAALIASYGDETPATPAAPSRFRVGTANIVRTLASGTVAGLILFGVTFATRPGLTAAASRSTRRESRGRTPPGRTRLQPRSLGGAGRPAARRAPG